MTKPGLPRTIPLGIPTDWTPEQALAVFEILDDIREKIWAYYRQPISDLLRQQHQPVLLDPGAPSPDDLSF